jgi:hypothetical protein
MPSACLGPIRPGIPDDVHDQDGEEAEQDHGQKRPSRLEIDDRAGKTRERNELPADRGENLGEGDDDGEDAPEKVAPLLLAHDSASRKGHG